MNRWKVFEQCDDISFRPTALYNRDTNIYIVKPPKGSLSPEKYPISSEYNFPLGEKPN
jgi:hypothetical protein